MIHKIVIPVHSPEWHAYRLSGIGASDGSSVVVTRNTALSQYSNPTKLYYEKIGEVSPFMGDNPAMFHGRMLEDYVCKLWEYYDGTPTGYIENYKAGKVVRKNEIHGGFARNDKYPWLFASLDRFVPAGTARMDTWEISSRLFPLEAKTISGYESDKWELGIPRSYLCQVHIQMIVFESDYSEIAILKDGRNFDVLPVPYSSGFGKIIIDMSYDFWYNRVVPGKKAHDKKVMALKVGDVEAANHWDSVIQRLEPEPVAGDSYKEFMSEKFRNEVAEVLGGPREFHWALRYKNIGAIKKVIEERYSFYQNCILNHMVKNGAEKLDFGKNVGYVKMYKKKGEGSSLRNYLKVETNEPAADRIVDEIQKMIISLKAE